MRKLLLFGLRSFQRGLLHLGELSDLLVQTLDLILCRFLSRQLLRQHQGAVLQSKPIRSTIGEQYHHAQSQENLGTDESLTEERLTVRKARACKRSPCCATGEMTPPRAA